MADTVKWRPPNCPSCYSAYENVRGVRYRDTSAEPIGRCEDRWHRGAAYDESKLVLTAEDQSWLAAQGIGF